MKLQIGLVLMFKLVLASKDQLAEQIAVRISKCCEPQELLVDGTCTRLENTNETHLWKPEFINEDDRISFSSRSRQKTLEPPIYEVEVGPPKCESNEHQSHVYYYPSSPDRLGFLSTGSLRHFIEDSSDKDKVIHDEELYEPDEEDTKDVFYDYPFGRYCVDKAILNRDKLVATYANICVPKVVIKWNDTGYMMRHAVNPTLHAISIVCYLIVAVVYFVLPQLRDLVGNMITSIALCLICSQCASTVKIFTDFGNHVSFLVADAVLYVSLLGAFFWLNALGYYIWHTFRSRNIFLRTTDGRKYCYYSSYVVGFTMCIAATAIFAHFTLETKKPKIGGTMYPAQEVIGWLGMSIIFTAIFFTIIVNLCFVLSTSKTMRKMSTYGRIHHKLKYNSKMFTLLYGIMSIAWIFLLLAQLKYDGLIFCNIVVNALQAMAILYVCVFGQKRVMFLLGKTCNCCSSIENVEGLDWGEELAAINAGY